MTDKQKSNKNSESRLLAHWRFTNEQWKEFLYYEKLDFESRGLVDARTVLVGGVIVIGLLSVMALFGSTGRGYRGGPAASLFVLIAGSLFLGFCFLIHRLVRKSAENRLKTLTGEIQITNTLVSVNGVIFDWGKGWSRPEIYKEYIYLGEEKMTLLSFICTRWARAKSGTERFEKKCLVPVPPGKEAEADFVISEIKNQGWTNKANREIK